MAFRGSRSPRADVRCRTQDVARGEQGAAAQGRGKPRGASVMGRAHLFEARLQAVIQQVGHAGRWCGWRSPARGGAARGEGGRAGCGLRRVPCLNERAVVWTGGSSAPGGARCAPKRDSGWPPRSSLDFFSLLWPALAPPKAHHTVAYCYPRLQQHMLDDKWGLQPPALCLWARRREGRRPAIRPLHIAPLKSAHRVHKLS